MTEQIPDTSFSLWYDPQTNRFNDEDGRVLHDLHEWFAEWVIRKVKEDGTYTIIVNKLGEDVEIFFPETDEPPEEISLQNDIPWEEYNRYCYAVDKEDCDV